MLCVQRIHNNKRSGTFFVHPHEMQCIITVGERTYGALHVHLKRALQPVSDDMSINDSTIRLYCLVPEKQETFDENALHAISQGAVSVLYQYDKKSGDLSLANYKHEILTRGVVSKSGAVYGSFPHFRRKNQEIIVMPTIIHNYMTYRINVSLPDKFVADALSIDISKSTVNRMVKNVLGKMEELGLHKISHNPSISVHHKFFPYSLKNLFYYLLPDAQRATQGVLNSSYLSVTRNHGFEGYIMLNLYSINKNAVQIADSILEQIVRKHPNKPPIIGFWQKDQNNERTYAVILAKEKSTWYYGYKIAQDTDINRLKSIAR